MKSDHLLFYLLLLSSQSVTSSALTPSELGEIMINLQDCDGVVTRVEVVIIVCVTEKSAREILSDICYLVVGAREKNDKRFLLSCPDGKTRPNQTTSVGNVSTDAGRRVYDDFEKFKTTI